SNPKHRPSSEGRHAVAALALRNSPAESARAARKTTGERTRQPASGTPVPSRSLRSSIVSNEAGLHRDDGYSVRGRSWVRTDLDQNLVDFVEGGGRDIARSFHGGRGDRLGESAVLIELRLRVRGQLCRLLL